MELVDYAMPDLSFSDDPENDLEALTPEERERSQRLFEKLAAEEPPFNEAEDTAAGRTAPRQAILTEDTRPMQAFAQGRQYTLTLGLGLVLVASLVVTVVLFLSSGEETSPQRPLPPTEVALNPTNTLRPSPTAQMQIQVEQAPTPAPAATATSAIEPFLVQILPPTALPEERNAWALTPIAPPVLALSAGIPRQDEAFTIAGASTRLEVIPYVVQAGDTLTGVADKFDLDVCSVVWSNPRNKVSPMRPGYVLDILPVDGVLYTVDRTVTPQQIAEATLVDVSVLLDSPYNPLLANALPESPLPRGMKVVVPNGDGGNCNVWAASPSTASSSGGSGGTSGGGGGGGSLWGCGYAVEAGGFAGITPVSGNYTFFQGFTLAHTGVDLAASTGTPVVSAGAGAVAYAGWNEYGYGNVIVIDHGGIYSLYAHLSSINVSCGQQVGAGSVIGAVGSTGRSSGPHLHFEVRDAGFNPVDPSYSIAL
jgi:murein DD-endopeptidase MepM/ murein hydrolase activator NlpD